MSNENNYANIEVQIQELKRDLAELKGEIKINSLKIDYVKDSIHSGFFATTAFIGFMAFMIIIANLRK